MHDEQKGVVLVCLVWAMRLCVTTVWKCRYYHLL